MAEKQYLEREGHSLVPYAHKEDGHDACTGNLGK